jgi:hypothetical protein
MKDKLGQELSIGDTVVFNPPVYKGLAFGKVASFTPKGCRVAFNRSGKQVVSAENETSVQFSIDVVKVTHLKSI